MRVRATADQQPWNKFEKVFNQAVPTLHGPGLAFPAGVNVQHGKWLAVVVFAVLPRTAESVSEAQGPRLIGKSKCLPRAKVITDDLMLPASRQVADVVEIHNGTGLHTDPDLYRPIINGLSLLLRGQGC